MRAVCSAAKLSRNSPDALGRRAILVDQLHDASVHRLPRYRVSPASRALLGRVRTTPDSTPALEQLRRYWAVGELRLEPVGGRPPSHLPAAGDNLGVVQHRIRLCHRHLQRIARLLEVPHESATFLLAIVASRHVRTSSLTAIKKPAMGRCPRASRWEAAEEYLRSLMRERVRLGRSRSDRGCKLEHRGRLLSIDVPMSSWQPRDAETPGVRPAGGGRGSKDATFRAGTSFGASKPPQHP